MKKSKSLFCVVLRAYFTTSFFYVLNCRLNLLAVLSSFQLHKRFLSDPGPNRNNLLLSRLDRCLSGWCCYKIYQLFIVSFFSENGVPPSPFWSPTPYHFRKRLTQGNTIYPFKELFSFFVLIGWKKNLFFSGFRLWGDAPSLANNCQERTRRYLA